MAHFIKYFPTYVLRIENQLAGTDGLEIRGCVDAAYDRIVQSMFDGLVQMAKLDGDKDEDKGVLNYHVILIGQFFRPSLQFLLLFMRQYSENMHHFIGEISQLRINASRTFKKRAQSIYDDNLSAYVRLVLRRPFSRIIVGFCLCPRCCK